jgi:CO/xanthine dehydrogenase FAD-binding subunit
MTALDHAPEVTDQPRTPVTLLIPRSLDEALHLLAADGAAVLGGGVGHTLRRHERRPAGATSLVAVGSLPELTSISWADDHIAIGAAVRLSTIEADRRLAAVWPMVTGAAGSVATARIRRMVTLGGNIAAADDSHDPPVALAAADARLTVRSVGSTRTLAIGEVGGLRPGELVQDVRLPVPPAGRFGSAYEKFLVRGLWEYACVNVGAVVHLDDAGSVRQLSLAVGSVAHGPVTVDLADLRGGPLDAAAVAEAARRAVAATRPYSDVRGSAAYKSRMIAEFTRRAMATAAHRAAEGADR